MNFKVQHYLSHPKFPILLLYFEIENFMESMDQIPKKILSLQAIAIFSPSIDPDTHLDNKIAHLSRVIQMYLIYQKLNHWLLRSQGAIPSWQKQLKQYKLNNQLESNTIVGLDNYLALSVKILDNFDLNKQYAILLNENQTQFLLANMDRNGFSKAKQVKIIIAINFMEVEFQKVPDSPELIKVIHFDFKYQNLGLGAIPKSPSFPEVIIKQEFILEFLDLMECLHALQNLNLAKKEYLKKCRENAKSVLGLN
ncbi:hypothetical protein K502DRAFT_329692 [Neoconidiobolus thromboides FSU 785]|nr:hypothetical protein K502DRAFT_329692 [Neoconidiobolus thromboides FSU 785]